MAKTLRGPRPKHVPQRTCIACRQVAGKRGLVRLVRAADGTVQIDATGKQAGRGAYLHPVRSCWEIGLKGNRIEQALRVKLTQANRQALQQYAQSLPEQDQPEQVLPEQVLPGADEGAAELGGAEAISAAGAQSQVDAVQSAGESKVKAKEKAKAESAATETAGTE